MPPGTARCVERAAFRNLVREGAVTLYGFATGAEKQAFDLLTRVQHVGPKLALAVLSVMAPEELAAAIVRGDVDRIDAVPGVGRKVAERVVRGVSAGALATPPFKTLVKKICVKNPPSLAVMSHGPFTTPPEKVSTGLPLGSSTMRHPAPTVPIVLSLVGRLPTITHPVRSTTNAVVRTRWRREVKSNFRYRFENFDCLEFNFCKSQIFRRIVNLLLSEASTFSGAR